MENVRASGSGFSDRRTSGDTRRKYDLVRVKAGKFVAGIILNDRLVCRQVHRVGKASLPCDGDGCDHCHVNNGKRWYGWLAVYGQKGDRTLILEIPDGGLEEIERFQDENHTLRGAVIRATRPGVKTNGPVRVIVERGNHPGSLLPACPDVVAILCRIWCIDADHRSIPGFGSELRERAIAALNGSNGSAH